MKKTSTILLLCSTLAFVGCSDSSTTKETKQEKTPVVKTAPTKVAPEVKKETTKTVVLAKQQYTIDEIYMAMCIQCHSSDGSGNTEKLTPSMTGLSQAEIQAALTEVEKDQGHIIMEHNRGEILKMGMEYPAKEMAEYMYNRFHK